jgi:hypothetical protein
MLIHVMCLLKAVCMIFESTFSMIISTAAGNSRKQVYAHHFHQFLGLDVGINSKLASLYGFRTHVKKRKRDGLRHTHMIVSIKLMGTVARTSSGVLPSSTAEASSSEPVSATLAHARSESS